MILYDDTQLHEALESAPIPDSIKQAIKTTPVAETVVDIGHENDLKLNEIGELYQITEDLLLGNIQGSDFTTSLKIALERERRDLVPQIIEEINQKILLKIRENARLNGSINETPEISTEAKSRPSDKREETPQRRKSAYGTVGSFTPKNSRSQVPKQTQEPDKTQDEMTTDRKKILSGIEDPQTAKKASDVPSNLPTDENAPHFSIPTQSMGKYGAVSTPPHTEDLSPESIVLPEAPKKQKTSWQIQPRKPQQNSTVVKKEEPSKPQNSADPYREPAE